MTDYSSIRSLLINQNLDSALITSVANIAYLTGYTGFSPIERDAYLLVTKKNIYLFTSPLYSHEVESIQGIQVVERTAKKPFKAQFSSIAAKEKLTHMGIEEHDLTVAEYQLLTEDSEITLYPLSFRSLRLSKTLEEIAKIKKACEIGDQALTILQKRIKVGMTELEVALELELLIRKEGAFLSFPTIAAFGKNSAIPHHHTDDTQLKENDVVLIDFGVNFQNYCSDMTRTFFIGTPTAEHKNVYNVVSGSQKKAIEFLSSEISHIKNKKILAADVDKIARDYITDQGFPSIPHSLGHGIGIEVHEAPALSPNSKDELTEGMVFSLEPGIYLPNKFGVRIEDLFVINNNKLVKLTSSSSSFKS